MFFVCQLVSELLKKTSIPAAFSMQVIIEVKFATSPHHRINENNVRCVHPANDRPTLDHWLVAL